MVIIWIKEYLQMINNPQDQKMGRYMLVFITTALLGIATYVILTVTHPKIFTTKPVIGHQVEYRNVKEFEGKDEKVEIKYQEPYLLHFFAPWCDHCRKEYPNLKEIKAAYPKLKLVGVIYRSKDESVRWLKENQGEVHDIVLNDELNTLRHSLDVNSVPTTFVMSADNKVVFEWRDPLSLQVFKEKILPEMKKDPIPISNKKAASNTKKSVEKDGMPVSATPEEGEKTPSTILAN
jgi:thiol-disulfide isomerase/thioredoxin